MEEKAVAETKKTTITPCIIGLICKSGSILKILKREKPLCLCLRHQKQKQKSSSGLTSSSLLIVSY